MRRCRDLAEQAIQRQSRCERGCPGEFDGTIGLIHSAAGRLVFRLRFSPISNIRLRVSESCELTLQARGPHGAPSQADAEKLEQLEAVKRWFDVAAITGLSPETLAQWRWLKKEIPFVRLGKKCVRYRQSDIDA
jgi:predicted DNA-binding transcriptional regulator AlpA